MKRKTLININKNIYKISAGGIFLFLSACNNSGETKDIKPPNIILIVSDDQGYNDTGVYGGKEIQTPNLDRLANEGIRFTNFYVTCPVSTPSRCSLFTGRYPQRNGTYELFRNNRVNDHHQYDSLEYSTSPERILGTDLREVFFPELLRKAGYVNGIFGKWDIGQLKRFLPLQRGFDDFYGFVSTGIDYYTHERYGVHIMYRNNTPSTEDKGTYCTYLFEREALRFVKENKDNPFFLYLPFNAPHVASSWESMEPDEILAPPEYLSRYPSAVTPKDKSRRGFMAATTCMDNSIGNILKLVDDLGLTENTMVIFFSDNGAPGNGDNAPLSGGKASMWEGGIRVPCIIKWPATIEKGQVINNFISSLELFPTILAVAGIKKPDSLIIDGFNILNLLTGKEKNLQREEMFWEFRGQQAARVGDMKLIKSSKANGLFNLANDIGEKNDLSKNDPESYNRIMNKFNQWKEEMDKAEPRGPFRDF